MSAPLVVYHAACYDGFTASWVAQRALGDCVLFPATYGDEAPVVAGRKVYVLDFSYPRDVMIAMNSAAERLVVLDHHKTAASDCEGLSFCTFDMERSGAGLAWDHFFGRSTRPWLIDAIEDRDLWRFAHPHTKAVHAYVSSLEMTMENWNSLHECALESISESGSAIQRSIAQYCEKVAEASARVVNLFGCRVVTATAPYVNCSELAHTLLDRTRGDSNVSLTYYQSNRGDWVYSLRGREGSSIDVSDIAKSFGGGGHALAAGFRLPHLLGVLKGADQ